ncbi:MAG: hypothetical protein ACLFU2_09005 [Opitutales bacterium]
MPADTFERFRRFLAAADDLAREPIALTTREEQLWCRYFGEHCYEGGALVELGPFLGSLTMALQEGLARNPQVDATAATIHAWDLFRWENWCEDHVKGTELAGRLTPGESFEPLYRGRVRGTVPVVTHAEDLLAPTGVPGEIGLLLNDAVKTWEVGLSVGAHFFPSMTAGATVAHQDFLWPTEAFLVPLMYLWREQFVARYVVPGSCMAVFERTGRPISAAPLVDFPGTLAALPAELIDDAFAWFDAVGGEMDRDVLHLCQATTLWRCGHLAAAQDIVQHHELRHRAGSGLFEFQRDILRQWGYAPLLERET